ncbi:MAG: hypothetical protein ACI93R_003240 [Flavobacteriales bacterium]
MRNWNYIDEVHLNPEKGKSKIVESQAV